MPDKTWIKTSECGLHSTIAPEMNFILLNLELNFLGQQGFERVGRVIGNKHLFLHDLTLTWLRLFSQFLLI